MKLAAVCPLLSWWTEAAALFFQQYQQFFLLDNSSTVRTAGVIRARVGDAIHGLHQKVLNHTFTIQSRCVARRVSGVGARRSVQLQALTRIRFPWRSSLQQFQQRRNSTCSCKQRQCAAVKALPRERVHTFKSWTRAKASRVAKQRTMDRMASRPNLLRAWATRTPCGCRS